MNTILSRMLLLALAVLSACAISVSAQEPVVVHTPAGDIEGVVGEKAYVFRGIPYARPPVGDLRFKSTVRAPAVKYINATEEAPGCYQECVLPHWTCPDVMSEDCLYLNVFSPLTASSSSALPVLVFFHGGNYKMGFGGGPLYNGSYIAEQADVVVVSLNYRLGAFGYLSIPEIGMDDNLGVKDQRVALEWVRDNIAAFGGSPDRVTIFGQSAGGGSVAAALISPKARGLFSGALSQSNPWGVKFRDAHSMQALAQSMAKQLRCAIDSRDSKCWYEKTSEEILKAQNVAEIDFGATGGSLLQIFLPWAPMSGTDEVPYSPNYAFANGHVSDVPLVVGAVREEALLFIYEAFNTTLAALDYTFLMGAIFPDLKKAQAVLDRYPPDWTKGADNRPLLSQLGTEYIFQCPQRNNIVNLLKTKRSSPIYGYLYSHVLSFGQYVWGDDHKYCWDHVCHGGELPVEWNSSEWLFPFADDERALARNMVQYWGNFAHTGNPSQGPVPNRSSRPSTADALAAAGMSGADAGATRSAAAALKAAIAAAGDAGKGVSPAVAWPAYTSKGKEQIWLAAASTGGIKVEADYMAEACDFWDKIGYVV